MSYFGWVCLFTQFFFSTSRNVHKLEFCYFYFKKLIVRCLDELSSKRTPALAFPLQVIINEWLIRLFNSINLYRADKYQIVAYFYEYYPRDFFELRRHLFSKCIRRELRSLRDETGTVIYDLHLHGRGTRARGKKAEGNWEKSAAIFTVFPRKQLQVREFSH